MCHWLASQSDSSTLVICLIYTPTTVDANGAGDRIQMPSDDVGDEGEDKSIAAGAQSRRPSLVVLWTLGREKFILSGR